ncbi:MAG: CotH kinase family protein [Cryomorphaceae bacterium]|nr:CotH kinase family protein [Cryomorphaceae bacterium]
MHTFKCSTLTSLFFVFTFICNAQSISINEIMASNRTTISDEDDDYEDWIELYNFGADSINLFGYGLSDNAADPFRWTFPQIELPPGEYLLVWASGKNRTTPGLPLHTNFSISASGEDILLTRNDSVQIDFVPATTLAMDVSYGRQPNGTGSWLYFYTPTPNTSNIGTGLTSLLNPPFFSHASGLYTSNFTLTINHANPNVTIVYTLDGSEPDINNIAGTNFQYKNEYKRNPATDSTGSFLGANYQSHIYSGGINIVNRSVAQDSLTKKNSSQHPMYFPPGPVRKGTVVRAKVYIGDIGSKTATQTYFVWPNGNPYNIPVISLTTPEKYLFDYNDGIYTAGVDFDNWRTNNPTNTQWWRPEWNNYWRRGREWEYPMNIEIFEANNFSSILNQDVGFRIHGNNSRTRRIKNLRLYARGQYHQESTLTLPGIFKSDVKYAHGTNTDVYKRLMLRTDGTGGPVFFDVVMSELMLPMFPGLMRNSPVIHFINGEFWGISAIRDRIDRHHYANQFGLDADDIIQIDCKGINCDLGEGDSLDLLAFNDFKDSILHSNFSSNAAFERIDSLMDIENFIDHMVLQVYSSDDSYERNFWRVKNVSNAPYGDGKWRVDVQDFDASLKLTQNWLATWAFNNPAGSTGNTIFGKLLENENFTHRFLVRFADLINSTFVPWRFQAVVDSVMSAVFPYLIEDYHRSERDYYLPSEEQELIDYSNEHPDRQRDSLVSYFGLSGKYNVTLNVSDTMAGYVKINTVEIKDGTVGVESQPYPWSGVYFNDVPITLIANANPGFIFTHWSGDISNTDDTLHITRDSNLQIQANFINDTMPDVIYFWLMDNALPNNQPLDSLVATYSASGEHAVIHYQSCLQGYPFNSNHPNWRKASLERRNAPTVVNYRASANNDLPFGEVNMRGIQIRQPFRLSGEENTIIMNFSTRAKKEIKLSFAAEDQGAADLIRIDYWDGNQWTHGGLSDHLLPLGNSYQLYQIDFSGVNQANNNPNFRIRIRFDGADMRADNGNRVHLNNIAVEGVNTLSKKPFVPSYKLKAFPNPTEGNLTLQSNDYIISVEVMNLFGQTILRPRGEGDSWQFSLESLPSGMYLVRVKWSEGEKIIRLIKK